MTAMAFSNASTAELPRLDVTGGVHRGVSLSLDEPEYTVGSGASASLTLSDTGVAEQHLRLRFKGRQVDVEAAGGDVRVLRGGRETLLARGHGLRARLPLELRVGGASLKLDEPPRGVPVSNPVWYGKVQWSIAALFMFICAGAWAVLRDAPLYDGAPESLKRLSVVEEQPAPVARAASLQQVQADMAGQAKSAGLKGLQVEGKAGQVHVTGTLQPGQEPQWLALQQYFDGRYGRQFVLRGDVAVHKAAERPRVNFQAVWFGENPYVINASGSRLYPGAPLEGGWTLERIEEGQVVLALGDERFALTLER